MHENTQKALAFATSHRRQLTRGLPLRHEELAKEKEKLRELDEKLEKLEDQRAKAYSRVLDKSNQIEDMEVDAENLESLCEKLTRPRESFDMPDDEYSALCHGFREEIARITGSRSVIGIGAIMAGF